LRTIPHVTEFAKSHHAQGLAEGKAEAVLAVLAARGIELTAEQRHRVQHGASPADLDKWLGQAATAHSADEVFA
jgi:hypothetical protein